METTMNPSEPMNWQSFKNALVRNPDKFLQFQYAENRFVDASFHITEVKQAPIVSVDCGGKMNSWTEIIVQLWEPSESESSRSMKVSKALSIFQLVEKSLPLNPLATVKIEFGNSKFDTRQMYPGELIFDDETFTVNLTPDYTQCKALTRGQSCGTATPEGETCCTPAVVTKSAPQKLEPVAAEAAACTPGGGCC
jgi:hypothetical protein